MHFFLLEDKFYRNHQPLSTIISSNDIETSNKRFDSADDLNKNRRGTNPIESFSDDQFNLKKKKANKNINGNHSDAQYRTDSNAKNSSSSSSSASASSISPIGVSNLHAQIHGHRQCSSYDTSMIDTSESYDNDVRIKILERCFF